MRRGAHARFCTCSRNWSMTAFSSMPIAVSRRSNALEQSVLASRLNSCARKSRRRPTASPRGDQAARARDVAAQAVELLAHVGARRRDHRLLMQPVGVEAARIGGQQRHLLADARSSAPPARSADMALRLADHPLDPVDLIAEHGLRAAPPPPAASASAPRSPCRARRAPPRRGARRRRRRAQRCRPAARRVWREARRRSAWRRPPPRRAGARPPPPRQAPPRSPQATRARPPLLAPA